MAGWPGSRGRLSRMLRLARLKKIISKYSHNPNLQVYIQVWCTLHSPLGGPWSAASPPCELITTGGIKRV